MKLTYPDLEKPIIMDENSVNILVVENPHFLTVLVKEFINQIETGDGRFILFENGGELNLCNNAYCIVNPFCLDFNQRKILTKIYGIIKEEVQSTELLLTNNNLYADIFRYVQNIIDKSIEIPLKFSLEMDVLSILKMLDVKVEFEDGTCLENLIEYIKLMDEILGKKVAVFVNLKSYLGLEELRELYKYAKYHKINLVLIEGHMPIEQLELEQYRIVDKDLCEIY